MADRLNILMITHKTRAGIVPRSMVMASNLVERGHHAMIIAISRQKRFGIEEYYLDGVRIVETPDMLWGRLRTGWDPWNLINRLYFLSKENGSYNLVHTFESRPASIYPALYFSRKHNLPLITDWNDWFGRHGLIDINRPIWYRYLFGGVETYYEETFRAKAAGLTVISSMLQQRAIGLGVDPKKICFISGGAFLDLFTNHSIEECRQHSGFKLDEPMLGFSSANSHLDMEIVLQSLKLVSQKYPEMKLIITGEAKEEIHKLVKKFDVQNNVIFTGFLPLNELQWYLGSANVFLLPMADLPYNQGRWPNKMCDYMCMARPTVSNPVGDIKRLMEQNAVGCLAAWTPEDFAQKILYLLDHPSVSAEYGRNARKVAEEQFDWKKLIVKLEDFYYKILNEEQNK